MKTKYFGTDGIRGKVGDSLITPDFVLRLGWAVGKVLGKQAGSKVLIGKDTRISGYMLESALEAGLSAAGVDILLLGPMPTPAIAYLTRTLRAQAGIVISASHNPFYDNGIKFFNSEGTKLSKAVEIEIEAALDQTLDTVESDRLGKAERLDDAPGRYIEFCKSTFATRQSLRGLRIVVDCAHGATYHVAPEVFHELGAEVIKLGIKPNGLNINLNVGSTHPQQLQATVIKHQADLGIAFDGDGDRVVMVDHKGELVDGDELLYLMVQYARACGALHGGVVGTSMSNMGLEEAFKGDGILFSRTQVGDRHVMSALKAAGWLLGGESSGHIVHLGLTTTGDGIIAALQVLSYIVTTRKTLHELKQNMTKWPLKLVNIPVSGVVDLEQSEVVEAVMAAKAILKDKGRILLRASGTEPLVRLMVEAKDHAVIDKVVSELSHVLLGILVA